MTLNVNQSPPRTSLLPAAGAHVETDASRLPRDLTINIDFLLRASGGASLRRFFVEGGAEQAAAALDRARHIALLTGCNGADHKPDSDGPPGLAAIANALIETRKTITIVTDSLNKPPVREALRILNPYAADYVRFEAFDEKDGQAAIDRASSILTKYRIDTVVSGGIPGRDKDGIRHDKDGTDITPYNAALDELLLQANAHGLTTIAVGDNENVAGMAGRESTRAGPQERDAATSIASDYRVASWNTNLGMEAVAALHLAKNGMLDKLHTPEQQSEMITKSLEFGVDSVTRQGYSGKNKKHAIDTQEYRDTASISVRTGVDGFAPEVHAAMLTILRKTLSVPLPTHGLLAEKSQAGPFEVGAFDSSNGGLIAAKNLEQFLKFRSPHTANFIVTVDHDNAPYGVHKGDEGRKTLIRLVADGLHYTQKLNVDVIAMACNTACTAFPEAKQDLKVKVLDLIAITARKIAELGGPRPVLLATPATSESDMYPNKIRDAAHPNNSKVKMIGADGWAEMINKCDHLNEELSVQKFVDRQIQKYTDEIPANATSVWLCCTHYPALKSRIEDKLKMRALDIPVIDPMEFQAEEIIAYLNSIENKEDPAQSHIRQTRPPVVITSGKPKSELEINSPKTPYEDVQLSARELLAEEAIVYRADFSRSPSPSLKLALEKPCNDWSTLPMKQSASRSSAGSRQDVSRSRAQPRQAIPLSDERSSIPTGKVSRMREQFERMNAGTQSTAPTQPRPGLPRSPQNKPAVREPVSSSSGSPSRIENTPAHGSRNP